MVETALIRILLLPLACCVTTLAIAASPAGCLAGYKQALLAGGFTGPIVCSRRNATFRLIGTTEGYGYRVYDYRYRYGPREAAVMHGGQKIVILHNGTYVGQYALSPPPYVRMRIRGTRLILRSGLKPPIRLDLAKHLPSGIFINGETDRLYR